MKLLVVILTFLFSFQSFSQTPLKVWDAEFTFGGNLDDLQGVFDDREKGYITGGGYSLIGPVIYPGLARFSRDGSLSWKLVDSSQGYDAIGDMVRAPGESSFLVGTKFLIQKRDFAGQIIWQRNIGENGAILAAGNGFFIGTLGEKPVKFLKFSAANDSLDGWKLERGIFACVYSTAIHQDRHYVFGIVPGGSYTNYSGKILVQSITTKETLWTRVVDNVVRMFGTVDDSGNIYVSGTYYPLPNSAYWRTEKYSPDGNRLWFRLWDGDSSFAYNQGNWARRIIPYPGGGCVTVGSVTHQNPWQDPNDLDFAVMAYDAEGNRRWSMRWPPKPGWRRGDLWAAAWDQQGYLILVGSGVATTIPPGTRKCFLLKFWVPGVSAVPTPGISSLPPGTGRRKVEYRYRVSTNSRPDIFGGLFYRLNKGPEWIEMDSVGVVKGTPAAGGNYFVSVALGFKDFPDSVSTQQWVIAVEHNAPPEILSQPPEGDIKAGEPYFYHLRSRDLNGDSLAFSLSSPSWLSINPQGLISGTAEVGKWPCELKVMDGFGGTASQSWIITVGPPTHFSLSQNYPNPFNSTTFISFRLPVEINVRLVIYNLLGQPVRTLINNWVQADYHRVAWDGRDEAGIVASGGLYFYRLTAGKFTDVKKMILLR